MTAHPAGDAAADSRRAAWAYLSKVVLGPCPALSALIDMVGVDEAARAVKEWDLPAELRRRTEARRHIDTSAEDLRSIERLGGRLVTPDDQDWPAWRLMSFGTLDTTADPAAREPLALWVRGSASITALTDKAIAIVGTRAMSGYGERITQEIAGGLGEQGWTVVSGAAYGVDGAAHRASLRVGASTVAIMAGGVDRPYPAGHAHLLREIAETGLVISEYPPGTPPARHRFLVRNRLVAALSAAVLVVEAGRRSGARNTVKWARRLGRPTMAVPGSVTTASSVGCHSMIRDGEAILVTGIDDVLDEAGPLRVSPSPVDAPAPVDELAGELLLVYDALPASASSTPSRLAEDSGIGLAAVRAALPALELAGYVGVDDTGWYRKTKRSG